MTVVGALSMLATAIFEWRVIYIEMKRDQEASGSSEGRPVGPVPHESDKVLVTELSSFWIAIGATMQVAN